MHGKTNVRMRIEQIQEPLPETSTAPKQDCNGAEQRMGMETTHLEHRTTAEPALGRNLRTQSNATQKALSMFLKLANGATLNDWRIMTILFTLSAAAIAAKELGNNDIRAIFATLLIMTVALCELLRAPKNRINRRFHPLGYRATRNRLAFDLDGDTILLDGQCIGRVQRPSHRQVRWHGDRERTIGTTAILSLEGARTMRSIPCPEIRSQALDTVAEAISNDLLSGKPQDPSLPRRTDLNNSDRILIQQIRDSLSMTRDGQIYQGTTPIATFSQTTPIHGNVQFLVRGTHHQGTYVDPIIQEALKQLHTAWRKLRILGTGEKKTDLLIQQ